jgi:hypothetical protein
VSNKRETLARRATDDDVYIARSDTRASTQLFARGVHNAFANRRATGKIKFVGSAMYRVDFYGGNDIEASLLEA